MDRHISDLDSARHRDKHSRAFWRRHVDMGVGAFVVGAFALILYFVLTPRGSHRGALEIAGVCSIALWIAVFGPLGRWAVTTPRRRTFLMSWSFATIGVIAAAVALDGGARSPLGVLLVLPMLFAALVYPPMDVAVVAGTSELAYVLLVVAKPGPDVARALVVAVMLLLAGGISIMASVNRFVQERARSRLERRLHELATHDGLSGCLSYRAFREALEAESVRAQRYRHPFSLVLADLDEFKAINDTYGHDVGDMVVRGVGRSLRSGARAPDVVGRVGGDEFAILLPETTSVRAEQVANRLQAHVRRSDLPVNVTVSYGTATWLGPGDALEDVMRRADQALYAAKRGGRDRLAVWDDLGRLA